MRTVPNRKNVQANFASWARAVPVIASSHKGLSWARTIRYLRPVSPHFRLDTRGPAYSPDYCSASCREQKFAADNAISMGILRVYLAACVVFAHSEGSFWWPVHNGREAVQIFFLISGFYMALVLSGSRYQSIKTFYVSRFARIYIPYFIALGVVLLVSLTSGITQNQWLTLTPLVANHQDFHTGQWIATATNFTILGQDWIMFLEDDVGSGLRICRNVWDCKQPLWHSLWIPQAWSVGLELTFYLLAPFFAKKISLRALLGIVMFCLVMRFVTYHYLDLNYDPWVYRFFPFELANFCFGILSFKLMSNYTEMFESAASITQRVFSRMPRISYPTICAGLLLSFAAHVQCTRYVGIRAGQFYLGSELAAIFSVAVWMFALPFIYSLTRLNRSDLKIGELSYPIYLLHYTVILIITHNAHRIAVGNTWIGECSVVVTVVAAYALHRTVLAPVEVWRQRRIVKPSLMA